MAVSTEMKPAYLVAGTEGSKIAAARARLRERALREGGAGALEVIEAGQGRRAADAEALVASLATMSLTTGRRYLLADGVESWGKGDVDRVAEALADIPPETTVALFADGKPPPKMARAIERAGGEVLTYDAPPARQLPKRLVADARALGFELEPRAAALLVDRLGPRPVRLRTELERLALWAGQGGRVEISDLEAMVADTSEQAIWSLADAIVDGDRAATVRIAESLLAQGEALPRIVYALAPRLRQALRAARELEAGRAPKQVAEGLSMHPYAARMLVSRVKGRSPAELEGAIEALADLELWSRGGSDYAERVALTLALRRAAAGEGGSGIAA
jgi:DNA polymerase-3 subunit delta